MSYNSRNDYKGFPIKTFRAFALFFGLFFVLILTLGFLIYRANHNLYIEDAKNSVESVLGLTQELISHEKQLALSIALMLSQNETLKEGYLKNDRALLFETLQSEISKIKHYLQIENLEVQLHTKEAKAYVRSWDFDDYGDDLSTFRKGITLLHQTKMPLVAIELGKRLNIKALCPIYAKNEFIGSLEIIISFDEIAQKLNAKKINFVILMDKELLEIGEWMKELTQIDNYVIVSNSCPSGCINALNAIISTSTLEKGFARSNDALFGFTPLFDIEAKQVGYIGIWFGESLLKESLLLRASLTPRATPLHVKTLEPAIEDSQKREVLIR
ncbi:cache domain-containing protein [Sulfurospirillum halorespirans]|uniref:Methyl-accepting chemotaxis sensory transducer n=1 Tax=Sulfurospirillum halorespirans DSM 13726 TaxID=1193502 RepID=A0A1D7TGH9_9BACT|nr:cache domain-containing protein [Sulfurospirillum halorespirans]AOO64099.1 methyl-accepting chemotaxis sensory transducer [Sulfurospirillum halorespirans DSM 13726]